MNLSLSPKPTDTAHVPSYSLFAQLLAGERLTLRIDPSLKTAAFSPSTRVLMLPSWSGFSNESWLLFIAHEVGHALFTPADGITTHPEFLRLSNAHGFVVVRNVLNVFEDIRIERLVRTKYRGLAGVFGRGYHSLLTQKFFGFDTTDLSDAVWAQKSVLDRINIYAKVGTLVRRSLSTSQEIAWFNRGLTADTFEEMLTLTEEVILALNEEQKKQLQQDQTGQPSQSNQPSQKNLPMDSQPSQDAQDSSSSPNGQPSQDGQPSQEAQDGQPSQSNQPSQDGQPSQDAQEAQDGQPSQDAQPSKDAQDGSATANGQSSNPQPVEGQAFGSDPFAIPSQQSAEQALNKAVRNSQFNAAQDMILPVDTKYLHYNDVTVEEVLAEWKAPADIRAAFHQAILSQRREQSPILASMIASFRANQSAWLARRVQVSRTGAIDTGKLAQYKLTEDLFLRRRSLPEAQNHGFVIHVDWSGSMDTKLATVLWQVLHLIWFAESIKVPVSVFGFSDAGSDSPSLIERKKLDTDLRWSRRGNGRLLELYRSNASATIKQEAQTFLFALAMRWSGQMGAAQGSMSRSYASEATMPRSMRGIAAQLQPLLEAKPVQELNDTFHHPYVNLGGTPLYHALFASIDTVRKFRQTHRIEQCISVWLTDGGDTDSLNTSNNEIVAEGGASRLPSHQYHVPREGHFGDESSLVARLIDPRSGRTFVHRSGHALATLFEIHRALTGATVVCVDITSSPMESLRRLLSKTDLKVVANLLGADFDYQARRYSRRQGRTIAPKVIVQTRKRVVMPTTSQGDFSSTGLLLVTRKQYPEIGCDAYLVSHPDWWLNSEVGTKSATRGAADVLRRSNSTFDVEEDDMAEPMTAAERAEARDEEARRAPVRLNAALLEQHATVAMRRFTAVLVPYMAAGRDDASV